MVELGRVDKKTLLSTDKSHWQEAEKFAELFPQFDSPPRLTQPSTNEIVLSGDDSPALTVREWYMSVDGKSGYGPYTGADLLRRLRSGEFDANVLVWRKGENARRLAAEPTFAAALRSTYGGGIDDPNRLDPWVAEKLNKSLRFRYTMTWLSISITLVMSSIWLLPLSIGAALENQAGVALAFSGITITALAYFSAYVVSIVFSMMLLHAVWRSIPKEEARTTPGKAIGFLFIPLFNFYWTFIAYYGCACDINRALKKYSSREKSTGETLALLRCIFWISGVLTALVPILTLILFYELRNSAISLNEARSNG